MKTKTIQKTHLFSEVDLDLTKRAKDVWNDLFDICEQIGFMPSQEKYGFSVVGPFNIPDNFDLEIQFQVKKLDNIFKVSDIRAILRDYNTRKVKQTWYIFKDYQETEEAKRPML